MPQHSTTTPITRRGLLKCVSVGAASLSPLMAAIRASIAREATGGRPPLRFVFMVKSNGLWSEMIQPTSLRDKLPHSYETAIVKTKHHPEGAVEAVKDSMQGDRFGPMAAAEEAHDGKLNETMAPLAAFGERVTVLQGVSSGFPILSGSHVGGFQTLSATPARGKNDAVGQTLDAAFACAFPAPAGHLCLAHNPNAPSGMVYTDISAADRGQPNAFYSKPSRAYADLFGVVDHGTAGAQYDVQSNILDFHAEDAKRLRSEIAGPEREQLDRYLDAFDTIRQSRSEIEAMTDRLRMYAPEAPGDVDIENPIAINAANAKLAAAALISGLTNVVTFRLDTVAGSSYPGAGPMHSSVGHGQGGVVLHKRQVIAGSHFQNIATMAGQLDSIPEADGTMLDNTLFIYLADNGGNHHSSERNFPIMLLGNLGGRLKQGRYYAPGNEPKDEKRQVRVGDVWATLLAAARQPHKDFGIPRNSVPYQPIEALLT